MKFFRQFPVRQEVRLKYAYTQSNEEVKDEDGKYRRTVLQMCMARKSKSVQRQCQPQGQRCCNWVNAEDAADVKTRGL